MVEKVRKTLAEIKNNKQIYHFHVGNKNTDQVCSMLRRWKCKHVKGDEPFIFGYDYLKLTGEKVGESWAEYQAMGEKVDKFKRLSEELNCVIVTAIQLNRSGENFNRTSQNVVDDSSAIAISDRLQWFASFVGIFRRKTLDEITLDGQQFGTHKLIPVKTRFQGRDAAGHHDILRRRTADGEFRYVNNYLNFGINNFDVVELGSLRDIVALEEQRFELTDANPNSGEAL